MNEAVPLKTLKTQPLNLPKNRDAFYGGKWHKPISGRSADAINPGTGDSLGPVADCGAADIDAAVNAAKAAFPAWRDTPPLERARMLKRIANVLREHAEELAMIDAADCGNPYTEMVRDATIAAAQIEFYAGLVTEMKGSSIPMGPAESRSPYLSQAPFFFISDARPANSIPRTNAAASRSSNG